MAEIQPFNMVRYNDRYQPVLDRLISPPYDVISPAEQEAFYQADPLNIIRLVLGKNHPDDTEQDNRYTRAAAFLKKWLEEGVLVGSSRPGLHDLSDGFRRTGRRTQDHRRDRRSGQG